MKLSSWDFSRLTIFPKICTSIGIHTPFPHKKFGENRPSIFWEMGVQKFWGDAHFSSLTPSGGPTPDLTHEYYCPGSPEKKIFSMGGIGPHLGELWGFKNFIFSIFALHFLETQCSDVPNFWHDGRCPWHLQIKGFFKKFTSAILRKVRSKLEKVTQHKVWT